MLTHNAWFITTVMPKLFGSYITNSEGKNVAIQSICEDHVFEDLKRYPSAQDWANEIQWKDWMKNLNNKPKDNSVFDLEKYWKDSQGISGIPPNYYDPHKSLKSVRSDIEHTIIS